MLLRHPKLLRLPVLHHQGDETESLHQNGICPADPTLSLWLHYDPNKFDSHPLFQRVKLRLMSHFDHTNANAGYFSTSHVSFDFRHQVLHGPENVQEQSLQQLGDCLLDFGHSCDLYISHCLLLLYFLHANFVSMHRRA